MDKAELVILYLIFFGVLAAGIGSILYARRVMVEYAVSWELQLALFGTIIVVFSLMVSKILSKVNV